MEKENKKQVMSGEKHINSEPSFRIVAQREDAKGVYSNLAAIRHTNNEFFIDFLLKIQSEALQKI